HFATRGHVTRGPREHRPREPLRRRRDLLRLREFEVGIGMREAGHRVVDDQLGPEPLGEEPRVREGGLRAWREVGQAQDVAKGERRRGAVYGCVDRGSVHELGAAMASWKWKLRVTVTTNGVGTPLRRSGL